MKKLLKTSFSLVYQSTNITADVEEDLLSLSYSDKYDGEADELSIVLKDEKGKWAGSWFPTYGDLLKSAIFSTGYGKLYCGAFYIDSIVSKGSPKTFEIRGVSVPFGTTIRRERRNRAWEKTNLQEIALQVVKNGGLQLVFDSQTNPTYDRTEQKRESDLAFLARLCKEAELSLKISDNKAIIFDQVAYDRKPAIKTIKIIQDRRDMSQIAQPGDVINYTFESQLSDTYGECTVEYKDAKTGKLIKKTFYDDTVGGKAQSCKITQRVGSIADAERLAKAELRRRNLRQITGSLDLVGDVSLVAGCNIQIEGCGAYDGKFAIENAVHKIAPYTTQLKIRKVRGF